MTAAAHAVKRVSGPARLLWIALSGPEIGDEADVLLRAGAGGVVLFGRDITGPEQLRVLAAELRKRASGPLRIAIDHEGGHVARIGAPLTRFPSAMAIGATGSEELAEKAAAAAGRELTTLGIDVVLAPVVDVAADPRNPSVGARSFGSETHQVARFSAAAVRGYRAAGIASTAKHFPGHGRTPIDSHAALPVVEGGTDELRRVDLPPFRAAVEAGVELVMASHVAIEGLTDGLPSSLSEHVMVDLLRRELGFDGLVVTDAMVMRALADDHPVPQASVRSIASGADVVMPLTDQLATLDMVAAAISDGDLAEARVRDALDRATALDKSLARVAVHRRPCPLPNAEHAALALDIARRSLTLLSSGTLFPIDRSASVAVIDFPSRRASPVEELCVTGSLAPTVAGALRRTLRRTSEVTLSEGPRHDAERSAALEAARRAEVVILATRDAYLWPDDGSLIEEIVACGRPTILIALRNPYDVSVSARTDESIAAYADVPATLHALASALTGRDGWLGRLPMALPSRGARP